MYSSTMLADSEKSGCWRQVDYHQEHADSLHSLMFRSKLGIAAHAVLQYCLERKTETEAEIRKTAEEVGQLLIQHGRTFRGHHEPPLPPNDVWQGVDIAVDYILARDLPLDADALHVEQDWRHPRLPYTALIDLVACHEEGDEESSLSVCLVRDWKSSWQAGEDELHTLQRQGQAVCVWRNLQAKPDLLPDVIRLSVVNLRTWQEYTRDVRLYDEDDVAMLKRWERRLESLCETANGMVNPGTGERFVNPGAGCFSCVWRHLCPDAVDWQNIDGMNNYQLATELAKVEGWRSLIIGLLKAADVELPIPIEGGFVGFQAKASRVFQPGKEQALINDWFRATAAELPEDLLPVLTSLLKALQPGKSNLDAFAKALYPERRKGIGLVRDEYVEDVTDEIRRAQFGVWKDEKPKQ